MINEETQLVELSALISLIYDGSANLDIWSSRVLPALCQYLDMRCAVFFTPLHNPQLGGYLFNHGYRHGHIEAYIQKYQVEDPWAIAALAQRKIFEGSIIKGEDIVPRSTLLSSSFYKEWLAQDERQLGQMLGGVVFGTSSVDTMPVVCAMMRGLNDRLIGEAECARMALIMPHLSRSLGVMQRLRTAELTLANSLAALGSLPAGVVLIGHNGTVAFVNSVAQAILNSGMGLFLLDDASRGSLILGSTTPSLSKSIQQEISFALHQDVYATTHFSKHLVIPKTSGLSSYTLQFSALGNNVNFGVNNSSFAAIVLISDNEDKPDISLLTLKSTFNLTDAEARVAIALLKRGSAKQVAQSLSRSPYTVRTQIKRIYSKMQVTSRASFVKLMLNLSQSAALQRQGTAY